MKPPSLQGTKLICCSECSPKLSLQNWGMLFCHWKTWLIITLIWSCSFNEEWLITMSRYHYCHNLFCTSPLYKRMIAFILFLLGTFSGNLPCHILSGSVRGPQTISKTSAILWSINQREINTISFDYYCFFAHSSYDALNIWGYIKAKYVNDLLQSQGNYWGIYKENLQIMLKAPPPFV